MNLYTSEGWIDVPAVKAGALTFNILLGGRGIGKTFGLLEDVRLTDPRPFMLMRRNQVQADLISNPKFSPFKAIDRVRGCCTAIKKLSKYHGGVYEGELDAQGVLQPAGAMLGYTAALTTFHNVRGFSADEIEDLILDEFIPEKAERPIPDEWNTFRNAYETINRNREFEDPPRPPLRAWLLANSNTLANPYFIGLEIVELVDRMIRKGQAVYRDEARGLMIINFIDSPISTRKAQTALYRLTKGDEFTGMSLGNQFTQESRSRTGSIPLKELLPIVAVGELEISRHKSDKRLYGCLHRFGAPEDVYQTDDASVARFRARYGWLWEAYMEDRILWNTYSAELIFRKFFGENY